MSHRTFTRSARRGLAAAVAVFSLTGVGAVIAPGAVAQPGPDEVTEVPRGADAQQSFDRFIVRYLSGGRV